VTGARDLASFARAVDALRPYLDDLVFVGGWAHFLHTLLPEATALPFTPLMTHDADVAAPLRLGVREETIRERLFAAGFRELLSGEHQPPVSEYVLGDEASGFSLEFLAPLIGGPSRRDGRPDATVALAGVTAQKLRHLDLLLVDPLSLRLTADQGFPFESPVAIRVANPASYVVQKVLVLDKRRPDKQAKDLLYVHDTFSVFADALPRVRAAWDALRPRLHRNHVRQFEDRARRLAAAVTDLARAAVRVAADRPRPPTPELLVAALRAGFAGGFGLPRGKAS
jgi:hypothetical protein